MSPFTCPPFTDLPQMRNCALHVRVSDSYSDLVICLLKTQVVSEGTVKLKRSFPLSYAQHPAYVNLNNNIDYFLFCWWFHQRRRVYADNLGNRDQLFTFSHCPLSYLLSPIPFPTLISHVHLHTCHMHIHTNTLTPRTCNAHLFHGHVDLHTQTRYIYS